MTPKHDMGAVDTSGCVIPKFRWEGTLQDGDSRMRPKPGPGIPGS